MTEPSLRVELFPADLDRFLEFYVGVLRFELTQDRRGEANPYVSIRRGSVRIGAGKIWQAVDLSQRAVPIGVEIVIEVDDLDAEKAAILAAGYPLAEDLAIRPWGLSDFRLFDPDGYYLRFTTRAAR